MTTHICTCENEAEVLYKMYRTHGSLNDGEWTGKSSCCTDEQVHVVVSGNTVTVTYNNGLISTYTHSEDSTETFEQSPTGMPVNNGFNIFLPLAKVL